MYTSADKNYTIGKPGNPGGLQDRDIRTAFIYLVISIALAVAGAVYEHFSYGVWSNFMVYAFMVPLAGGTLPFMLRYLLNAKPAGAEWAWHAGIAALTTGSVVHGILAICGRPNHLTAVYLVAGLALLAAAVLGRIRSSKGVSEGHAGSSAQ